MPDAQQRLIRCFSAVFPELSPAEIVRVTPESPGNWDSLTAVTLLTVIQEEFGINIETAGTERDMSFEGILARVSQAARNRQSEVRSPQADRQTAED